MRGQRAAIALLIGLLAPGTGPSQRLLSNVTGFDAALLAGHVCLGSFETGAGRPESEGALQLHICCRASLT
jgi:hypothetical protein